MPENAWIVTQGLPGLENPSFGLAGALGLAAEAKRVSLTWPWSRLMPLPLFARPPFFALPDDLDAVWPAVVIGCGRQSIMPMVALKRRAGDAVLTIQLQDPRIAPSHFDVVVAPAHDRVRGANVLTHLGSLTRITAPLLEESGAAFPELAALPGPRIAVLIGGSNKRFRFTGDVARDLSEKLMRLHAGGMSLMITASRRTGEENAAFLRQALIGDRIAFWNGEGPNPYLAYLARADAILVTGDSVNMISEAASTGKPTYLIRLPGDPGKFGHFHEGMIEAGHLRPFDGVIDPEWKPAAFNETQRIASEIRTRMPQI